MRKFDAKENIKLLGLLIGPTKAVGESNADEKLIDANALKETIEKYRTVHLSHRRLSAIRREAEEVINDIRFAIDAAPTIDPVKWIPVSKKLPEVGRNVLLSVGKGLYTAEGELKHDGTWVQYRWSANIENVDAWAEMPETWEGDKDECDKP